MEKPYVIGSKKQLMIDKRFIAQSENIELVMNPPADKMIVLQSEKPWEDYRVLLTSVVDTGEKYLMYYQAMKQNERGGLNSYFCLAESSDGIQWSRPRLGLVDFQGSKDNNILSSTIGGAPYYAPHSPVEDPFIMLASSNPADDPDAFKPPDELEDPEKIHRQKDPVYGMIPNCVYVFTSKNGISWNKKSGPVMNMMCDCGTNQIFYDHDIRKHVAFLRGFDGKRNVVRYETDDPFCVPWAIRRPDAVPGGYGEYYITNELPIVMQVDDHDHWPGDVQNPCVFKYPWAQDVYLSASGLYRWYPGPVKSISLDNTGAKHRYRFFNDGPNDIHLFVSRDGKSFVRPSRWPYISLGIWGEADGGSLFSGLGMIRSNNELWQYYTASVNTHGHVIPSETNTMKIMRCVQRLDGFVSANAGHLSGEFVTPQLIFEGNQLSLNIDCGGMGEAWVEIQDDIGNPVHGFTLDDCDPVDLNHTHIAVTWHGRSDVSNLQNKPIRLRFRMRLAKLYSFVFEAAEQL